MTPTGAPGEPSLFEFSEFTVHSAVMVVYEAPALAERIRKSYGAVQIIGIDGFTEDGELACQREDGQGCT